MSYALVVDDNRIVADNVCLMLDMLQVKSQAVYSPRSALLAVRKQVPTVIFLDINMPGVSGFEVLRYLRRDPQTRQIPVFIVSSENQPETIAELNEIGIEAFLLKPFTMTDLEEALRQIQLI